MTDCLIIGFNDSNFENYVQMTSSMGTNSGAYRDLRLAFIQYEEKPKRSMDILNDFYFENTHGPYHPFNNADFLWPVILYLGTYLHKRGLSFDYVNLFHLEKEKLKEKLIRNDILTIAITTTLYVVPEPILEIISFIKEYNETAKIIVGGPYIDNQCRMSEELNIQQIFKYIGADFYVISQEGEATLVNLLKALKHDVSLDAVDNLAYRQGNQYRLTARGIESNPLEENFVDYSLFPQEEIGEFISLRTAKSCPFSCAFCGFPQRAGKYTYTSVDLVEQELNRLRGLGVTTLTFLDDTFNVPKQRFRQLLQMMIRNKYEFKWNSFYRSDHGDAGTIELMAKAGCEGVFLGVESGSDAILKRMNKSARRRHYLEAIPWLQAAGISVHANLIVGFPGETYGTVQESIDLIEETQPDFFRAQLWYADPVTPIWNQRDEYGIKGAAFNWSHNSMDSQTACDLVDKMFFSVDNSIWMPQYGFEQWSTFYLQRKGMDRKQVQTFMRCFNSAVKEQLLYPHKRELAPALRESLKRSCRFDDLAQPDMRPIEMWSASGYKTAEAYWMQEFRASEPFSNLEILRHKGETPDDGQGSYGCVVKRSVIDTSRESCGATFSEVILAAYHVLLSRLNGRQETVLVTALGGTESGGEHAVPLRLRMSPELSLSAGVAQIRQKMQQALRHRLYAFTILTNPWRLAEHGAMCPVFDLGYRYSETDGEGAACGLVEALQLHPEVRQGLGLVLSVAHQGNDITLHWHYKSSWFSSDAIDKIGSGLISVLQQLSQEPDMHLGDIVLPSQSEYVTVASGAREEFRF
ncbi:tRNA-2-methylthio-N(6)-dimethylallyladenosine synthase [Candidatus Entotheonellaceae bacterium PAL068K]